MEIPKEYQGKFKFKLIESGDKDQLGYVVCSAIAGKDYLAGHENDRVIAEFEGVSFKFSNIASCLYECLLDHGELSDSELIRIAERLMRDGPPIPHGSSELVNNVLSVEKHPMK